MSEISKDLLIDRTSQDIGRKESYTCKRDTAPQNITVILPAYNEEVPIGSIVLPAKYYADNQKKEFTQL